MARNYYAIFDKKGEPRIVTRDHRELVELTTGIFRDEFGYTYSPITRREARRYNREIKERSKSKKELSDRLNKQR